MKICSWPSKGHSLVDILGTVDNMIRCTWVREQGRIGKGEDICNHSIWCWEELREEGAKVKLGTKLGVRTSTRRAIRCIWIFLRELKASLTLEVKNSCLILLVESNIANGSHMAKLEANLTLHLTQPARATTKAMSSPTIMATYRATKARVSESWATVFLWFQC